MRRWILLLVMIAIPAMSVQAQEPARASRGARYVILIRHGMYDRDSTVDEKTGNGLNPLGREQARLAGERLRALPVRIGSLVSSDLLRARESAAIIGGVLGMKPHADSLLSECSPAFDRDRDSSAARRAEIEASEKQLAAAWGRYMRPAEGPDTYDVLVCHGNVTRWWVCRALGVDTRRWRSMDIGNGSLSVVAVRPDTTVRLMMFSDVGHIPVDRQTWTGRGPGWSGVAPAPAGARGR